jgi:hypothetical protein
MSSGGVASVTPLGIFADAFQCLCACDVGQLPDSHEAFDVQCPRAHKLIPGDRAKRPIPGLGYTVSYGVGNTLLARWGMVIVILLS